MHLQVEALEPKKINKFSLNLTRVTKKNLPRPFSFPIKQMNNKCKETQNLVECYLIYIVKIRRPTKWVLETVSGQ